MLKFRFPNKYCNYWKAIVGSRSSNACKIGLTTARNSFSLPDKNGENAIQGTVDF